jgi:uncharacterized membrane protein YeaQ/YmgE (transglycosylase-associated protein family)
MINVVGWFMCGAIVGFLAARHDAPGGLAAVLFGAAGTLGAVSGGVLLFIFDTTPLNALSPIGLFGALAGAIALVAVARRSSRISA